MLNKKQLSELHSEILSLREWLLSTVSYDDYKFLRKVEWIGRACTISGYLLVGLFPSWFTVVVSSFLIMWGMVSRSLMGHHCGHGAYDNIPGVPKRYHREHFGIGWRRYIDHFLLIKQENFRDEHALHHRTVNDPRDPDPVYMDHEHGAFTSYTKPWQKTALFWIQGFTWIHSYYSPHFRGINTATEGFSTLFNPKDIRVWKYWIFHFGPYALWYYVAIPSMFLSLESSLYVLAARLLAEPWYNIGTFCIQTTNHTGVDLYRFKCKPKTRSEWYWRQIVSSTNFSSSGNVSDYLHLYMNYQIEHHIVPNLPMNKYSLAKPLVNRLCLKYNIPYIEEPIWDRVMRLKVCYVGDERIKYYERQKDNTAS